MAIFVQINAMARQNDMGREGESEARAYLVKHGYNVLHTNCLLYTSDAADE